MTIAKKINRKKRNQKLFNKLMVFYLAIMVMCAFETVASAAGIFAPATDGLEKAVNEQLKNDPYNLQNVTNPDVLNEVTEKGLFVGLFRFLGVGLFRGLAFIINAFEKALQILLDFNIYETAKKALSATGGDVGKDIVKGWSYPIAWAVASAACIFVALLLIFNADKSRITDFARGIIISCCLLMALETLPSALNQMKNLGTASTEELNPSGYTVIDKDGTVSKYLLGDYLFASNIIDVDESVKAKNKVVYLTDTKTKLESVDFDEESKKIFQGLGSYEITENGEKITQSKYSSLSIEEKIELGGTGARHLYDLYISGLSSAQENRQRYDAKTDEEKKTYTYKPSTMIYMGEKMYYLEEDAKKNNGMWFETKITDWMLSGVRTKLKDRNIIKNNDVYDSKLSLLSYDSITNFISKLEAVNIKVEDYTFNALEWVNIMQNQDLVYKESSTSTSAQKTATDIDTHFLYTQEAHNKRGDIGKVIDSLKYPFSGYEAVYRYNYRFVVGLIEMAIVAVCLLFAGLKVASTLFDIFFAQVIAPIVVASDMHGNGRGKQVVQNLISSYIVLVCVVLLFRLYILVILGIKKDPSVIQDNFVVELMIILAGAKFVIDGPDIIVKILGIDAGVKSGLGTIMGIRTAAGMARGAAHSVSNVGHKVAHTPQKVANNFGQRKEAYRNSRDSGHGRARAVGSFITNGGITGGATGRAFNEGRNSTYSRNASTANRREDRQQLYNSGNSQQGGSSNNDGNTGGSSGAGGGEKGEKGDTGAKGDKGDKGEQGIQGMQGQKGEQGEKGKDADEGFAQRERREEQMRGRAFPDDR